MTRSTEKLHGNPQPDPGPITWRRIASALCIVAAIVFAYFSLPGVEG